MFRVLYYLPVITSWVVASLLFQYLFLTDGGLINWLLHDTLGVTSGNIQLARQPLDRDDGASASSASGRASAGRW